MYNSFEKTPRICQKNAKITGFQAFFVFLTLIIKNMSMDQPFWYLNSCTNTYLAFLNQESRPIQLQYHKIAKNSQKWLKIAQNDPNWLWSIKNVNVMVLMALNSINKMNLTSGLVFYNHLLTASFTNNTWHSCTIDSCKKMLLAKNFRRVKLSSKPLCGHFVQFWSWSKVLKVLKEQKAHKIEISSSNQSI